MKSLSSSRREVLVDCFHVHACHISHLLPGSAVLQHSAAALYNFRRLILRRPQVLSPIADREWMRQDIGRKESSDIVTDGSVSTVHFIWHPVSRAVGNVKNHGPELIEPVR